MLYSILLFISDDETPVKSEGDKTESSDSKNKLSQTLFSKLYISLQSDGVWNKMERWSSRSIIFYSPRCKLIV